MTIISKANTRNGPTQVDGRKSVEQDRGLIQARHLMTKAVRWVEPSTVVREVAKLLTKEKISAVPVMDDDEIVGIVSEADLIERQELGTETSIATQGTKNTNVNYQKSHGMYAKDVMTSVFQTVTEATPLAKIVEIMQEHQVRRVLVKQKDELIGIISRSDIVRLLASRPEGAGAPRSSDDDVIYYKVIDALLNVPGSSPWNTSVVVENGIIELAGSVEDENSIQPSVSAIEQIPHVQGVNDRRVIPQMTWG